MTNSGELAKELSRTCDQTHEHQHLVNGRAKDAAKYPIELCRAICRGLIKEKRNRALGISAVVEVEARRLRRTLPDVEAFHDREEAVSPTWPLSRLQEHKDRATGKSITEAIAWGDMTGMKLDAHKVKETKG